MPAGIYIFGAAGENSDTLEFAGVRIIEGDKPSRNAVLIPLGTEPGTRSGSDKRPLFILSFCK